MKKFDNEKFYRYTAGMTEPAFDITSDASMQTELANFDAVDGLDPYLDDMHEIEQVLAQTGLAVRGAADRSTVLNVAPALWPHGLVIDMALGIDCLEDILLRYNMTPEHWAALEDNRAFRIDLARARKEISETGMGFKRKAAVHAELYLKNMDDLMQDADVAPGVKKDIWTNMARLADLDPKKDKEDGVSGGMAFNIQINM